MCATVYEFDFNKTSRLFEYETLPIGAPIHNVRTRVVDSQLHDVSEGMRGELLLGGMGVSRRGYIDDHVDKNKNMAFVTWREERWYRTGDMVVTIEPDHRMFLYLGRRDTQVKLRGCRIELSEVETAVLACPEVLHCVVVLHRCEECDDDAGALAAYLVGNTTSEAIREHVIQKLPSYMLPTYIIVQTSSNLPTTLSSKIDRQLLAVDKNAHRQQSSMTRLTSIEAQVAALWLKVLNKQRVKNTDEQINNLTFAECGGNSLNVALLHMVIAKNFSINLHIHTHMSLKEMAKLLLQQCISTEDIPYKPIMHDLYHDDECYDSMEDLRYRIPNKISTILLTGATGFLGSFLLNELLTTTQLSIIILVRSQSLDEAKSRIRSILLNYELFNEVAQRALDNDGIGRRIMICPCGNLADAEEDFSDLDLHNRWMHIDSVLHCAADTNFNFTYEELRRVNVHFTKYLIKQCSYRSIPFYYVSSLSIFLFPNDDTKVLSSTAPYITENDQPSLSSIIGGYSQSKYVADTLVLRFLQRGFPGAIFRPGRVTGSSISGVGTSNDLFVLMLRGCHELGAFPQLEFPFDLTPVDMVSRAIVRIITRKHSIANAAPLIVHLINTKTTSFHEQFQLFHRFGCCQNLLESLPYNQWFQRLLDRVTSEQQQQSTTYNSLLPLLPFLQSSFWQHVERWPIFARTKEADAIIDTSFDAIFESYCKVWKRTGLFNDCI